MHDLGYYNGVFGPVEEMTVPFNDRVHFFGDGVYDVTYARNHVLYALEEHLDRFYNSAALMDFRMPMTRQELADVIQAMCLKVDDGDQLIYLQATRGTQPRNHVYPEDLKANLWMIIRPQKVKDVHMKVKIISAEDTRFFHCNIKTLNLIPSVMFAQMAERAGVCETVLYRPAASGRKEDARVTECAHANIHIINEQGVFQTAPTDHLILPGIARAHLIKACKALGYGVDEHPFTMDQLMHAREVIISSSGAFGLECTEIDGQPVGGRAQEMLHAIQEWVNNDYLQSTEVKH